MGSKAWRTFGSTSSSARRAACSAAYIRLQGGAHTVAGWGAYGRRVERIRLQGGAHTVAGWSAYICRVERIRSQAGRRLVLGNPDPMLSLTPTLPLPLTRVSPARPGACRAPRRAGRTRL
eukprot:scaffold73257_cov27-Phaeocystis_antarctica.AAC.1